MPVFVTMEMEYLYGETRIPRDLCAGNTKLEIMYCSFEAYRFFCNNLLIFQFSLETSELPLADWPGQDQ